MSFVDLPAGRMFYVDRPAPPGARPPGVLGAPTLLVHGLWDNAETWVHQLPRLGERCRVVAVDLRGHGRSGPPAGDWSTQAHADEVAALLERLGTGPVVAVGHSMGASVAAFLAVRRPDLVRALVALDPDYAGADDSRGRARALADALDGPDAEATALRIVTGLAQGPDTPAPLVERQRLAALWATGRTRARVFRGHVLGSPGVRFLPEAERVLRGRSQPVLALHRDVERMRADERCFTHPGSKAVAVPGAGHFLHGELPGQVNAEIDRWLATLIIGHSIV